MRRITGLMTLGMFVMMIAICCRRTNELVTIPPPESTPDDRPSFLQINITGIPTGQDSLYALITLVRKSGEKIYENGKLSLHEKNGVYRIDSIEVINEEYQINKLIVLRASDTAIYAVPRPQTEKSGLTNTPLEQIFAVLRSSTKQVNFQVVKINQQDNPQSFGYTTEDFGYLAFLDLIVDLSIKVGATTYDSLPAKVTIHGSNTAGIQWIREIELSAGSLHVAVPRQYDSYEFFVNKWNVFFRRTYRRDQLANGKSIHIDFDKPSRQLVAEEEWRETPGALVQQNRIEYSYYADRSLNEIKTFSKPVDQATLALSSTAKYIYHNNTPDTIYRYSGANVRTGYTALTYTGGVITNMLQKDESGEIGSVIEHRADGINFYYLFSNGLTGAYRAVYKNGNLISGHATTSRGTGETASYTYDSNINPYQQMNLPDLYLTRLSKNNKITDSRFFTGDIPMSVPSKFEYEYNSDGYPAVVWITYIGYSSGQKLYRVKRMFSYR